MSDMKLTKKQKQIYQFIENEIKKNGRPPTVREIAEELGIKSGSTIFYHLNGLEEKGLIKREKKISRNIEIINNELTSKEKEFEKEIKKKYHYTIKHVPLVGEVNQNVLSRFKEDEVEYFPLSGSDFQYTDLYIIKVVGNCLINFGIYNDDKIIIKPCKRAKSGDLVVILIGNTTYIKSYNKRDDFSLLKTKNDIQITIKGKVIGLIRKNIFG